MDKMNKKLFLDEIYNFYCNNIQKYKSPWEDKANNIKSMITRRFSGNRDDYMFVEDFINGFACDVEKEAFLSGLKFFQNFATLLEDSCKENIWASETWTDEDLISALQYRCIEPTEENISNLREACKGMFDDKSDRNEMIDDKVCELFEAFL